MELKDKFNILKQAAEAAQSKGVLSIDDAVYVKKAFECIDTNSNLDVAVKILSNVVHIGQSKGVYSLKDAYILYIVLSELEKDLAQQPKPELKPANGVERTEVDKSEETKE